MSVGDRTDDKLTAMWLTGSVLGFCVAIQIRVLLRFHVHTHLHPFLQTVSLFLLYLTHLVSILNPHSEVCPHPYHVLATFVSYDYEMPCMDFGVV